MLLLLLLVLLLFDEDEYNENDGFFYFYGTPYADMTSSFELLSPIEKGTTIYLNAFNISSDLNSDLTEGCLLEFSLAGDSGDIVKLGIDYLGNPCSVEGYSNTATLTEDVKYFRIKVTQTAFGVEFNNVIGITASANEPLSSFKKT